MEEIYRNIGVKSIARNIDGFKEIIVFSDPWFVMSDKLINRRTGNSYMIDVLYADGITMEILGYDEYTPFDIEVGDLFYTKEFEYDNGKRKELQKRTSGFRGVSS